MANNSSSNYDSYGLLNPYYMNPQNTQTSPVNTGTISLYNPQQMARLQQAIAARQRMFTQAMALPVNEVAKIGDIETTNKAELNTHLNSFIDRVNKTVDKYNGDYSQAAPEISMLIARERSNPFYTFNKQSVEATKLSTRAKVTLGANYMAAMDPSQVSYQQWQANPDIFSNYVPVNRQDIVKAAALTFQNYAKTMQQNPELSIAPGTGGQYFLALIQNGFKDAAEVKDFLNSPIGREMKQSIINSMPALQGLNSDAVDNAITEGAMTAIGQARPQFLPNAAAQYSLTHPQTTSQGLGAVSTGIKEYQSPHVWNNHKDLFTDTSGTAQIKKDNVEKSILTSDPNFANQSAKVATDIYNYVNSDEIRGLLGKNSDLDNLLSVLNNPLKNSLGKGVPDAYYYLNKVKKSLMVKKGSLNPVGMISASSTIPIGKEAEQRHVKQVQMNNVIEQLNGLEDNYKNIISTFNNKADALLKTNTGSMKASFMTLPTSTDPKINAKVKSIQASLDNYLDQTDPYLWDFLGYPAKGGWKKMANSKQKDKATNENFKTLLKSGKLHLAGITADNKHGLVFNLKDDTTGNLFEITNKDPDVNFAIGNTYDRAIYGVNFGKYSAIATLRSTASKLNNAETDVTMSSENKKIIQESKNENMYAALSKLAKNNIIDVGSIISFASLWKTLNLTKDQMNRMTLSDALHLYQAFIDDNYNLISDIKDYLNTQ